MVAEIKILMDMPLSNRFRQPLGPAILSIKNATEILPTAMLIMHNERDIVFSSNAFDI